MKFKKGCPESWEDGDHYLVITTYNDYVLVKGDEAGFYTCNDYCCFNSEQILNHEIEYYMKIEKPKNE